MRLNKYKKSTGQTYIIAAGFMAVAASIFFLVINTQRAVSDKLNLVNAADAAAFSGAAMAARELNFMALTNRTIIANEVAIGHLMTYQAHLDVIEDAALNGVGGILGNLLEAVFDLLGGDDVIVAFNNLNQLWSGAYILGVSAVNNLYQGYQEDEYRALAAIGRDSIIDTSMLTIISQYVNPDSADLEEHDPDSPAAANFFIDFENRRIVNSSAGIAISINNPDDIETLREQQATLEYVASEHRATDDQIIEDASAGNPFCALVMFATPSAPGDSVFSRIQYNPDTPDAYQTNPLWTQCASYYETGGTGAEPTANGFVSNPEQDGGALLSMLQRTAEEAPSSDWILSRDLDYRLFGVRIERRGQSEVYWDAINSQINWRTVGDDSIRTRGLLALLFSFSGAASGNAKTYADQASDSLDAAVMFMLEAAGLCEDEECEALEATTYTGVTRYAMLNPLMANPDGVILTAVLSQKGTCTDNIAQDEQGPMTFVCANNTDPGFLAEQSQIFAASQASIYYKRPECPESGDCYQAVSNEMPNLFNPFWQARLYSRPQDSAIGLPVD